MVRILDLVGKKEEYQDILNRTWIPPTYMYKDNKDMLLSMRKTQTVKALVDIKVDITRYSLRFHWRRARENNASSISGIHFGHYKLTARSSLL